MKSERERGGADEVEAREGGRGGGGREDGRERKEERKRK